MGAKPVQVSEYKQIRQEINYYEDVIQHLGDTRPETELRDALNAFIDYKYAQLGRLIVKVGCDLCFC